MEQVQVAKFWPIFCHKLSRRLWKASGMPPSPKNSEQIQKLLKNVSGSWAPWHCRMALKGLLRFLNLGRLTSVGSGSVTAVALCLP